MKRKKEQTILPTIHVEEITLPSTADVTKLSTEIEALKINQQSLQDEIIKLKKALIYTQKQVNLLQDEILKNKKLW